MTFCQKCGKPIKEDDEFCPECGGKTRLVIEKVVTEEKIVEKPVERVIERVIEKGPNEVEKSVGTNKNRGVNTNEVLTSLKNKYRLFVYGGYGVLILGYILSVSSNNPSYFFLLLLVSVPTLIYGYIVKHRYKRTKKEIWENKYGETRDIARIQAEEWQKAKKK